MLSTAKLNEQYRKKVPTVVLYFNIHIKCSSTVHHMQEAKETESFYMDIET